MAAPNCSWLVHGGLVLDPAGGEAKRRELIVRDGAIVAVCEPGGDARAAAGALQAFDASDTLVLPGLINAHTHGHANVMKGVADRWPLELSLTHGPWLSGPRDPETMYLSTLLGAIEMIGNGITSCYDLVYEFPRASRAGLEAVATAYADAGMRAIIAPMIADRSLFEAYPDIVDPLPAALGDRVRAVAPAAMDETIATLREIITRTRLPAGVRLGIAPTIPLHCSERFLAACRDLAAESGLPLHMHLAESRLQATTGARRYGSSLTAYVAACGLLGPNVTVAHAVWLDESDLDLLAATGTTVAHVPASNFRLGSGLARVRPMLERGIAVALATDGANSSDALDVFLAMRLASFTARAHAGRSDRWLSSLDVLRGATLGGAAALGLGERLGRPVVGYDADLIFLDLTQPAFVPLNDPLNQIVNCDAAGAVRDVMIDGRFVKRAGRVSAWTPELRARITASRDQLGAATAPARDLAVTLEPFVARYVAEHANDPLPMERYIR